MQKRPISTYASVNAQRRAKHALRTSGCSWERMSEAFGTYYFTIDAPPGKRFASDGVHCRVCSGDTPAQAYEDASATVRYGFEECTDPECEYCHPPEETENE